MASSISSQRDPIGQAQALVFELCTLNEKIDQQSKEPSFEQFAPMYLSYLDGVLTMKALNTRELITHNGLDFKETLANCYEICKVIDKTTALIFDKFVKIIDVDSQSLLKDNTPPELSKKCKSLLQRIQTFETLQPQLKMHPTISRALSIIEQIPSEPFSPFPSCSSSSSSSSASTALNPLGIPSLEKCIQGLPVITQSLSEMSQALDIEINKTDLNYFASIAKAFQETVNQGNGFMRIPFLDPEFVRVKEACLAVFKLTNKKINDLIRYFVKKTNDQSQFLKTEKTKITMENLVDLHVRLNKDIRTLLSIKQNLANNELIIAAMEILKQIEVEFALSEKQDVFGSSSSSSSSTSFSSSSASTSYTRVKETTQDYQLVVGGFAPSGSSSSTSDSLFSSSSFSFDPRVFGDISTPPDHKFDLTPPAKRCLSPYLNVSLSIVIPSNDQESIEISSITAPQNKNIGWENDPGLRQAINESEEEIVDEELLKAIALSLAPPLSNNESVKGKKEAE